MRLRTIAGNFRGLKFCALNDLTMLSSPGHPLESLWTNISYLGPKHDIVRA